MHEMSLCEGVLQVLEESGRREGFRRIKGVWLEIGALAGVEVASLRFCFTAVVRGTIADGAALTIIERPGEAWCRHCGKTVTLRQRYDECPDCGGYELELTAGDEMRIKELEVE